MTTEMQQIDEILSLWKQGSHSSGRSCGVNATETEELRQWNVISVVKLAVEF